MYCSKCGVNLAAGAAFCGSCGTPTGTPAAAIARPSAPPSYVGGSSHAAYADPAGLVVSRGFTYAGFWLRLVASLIDGVIMGLAAGVLLVPVFILTGMGTHLDGLAARHGRPDPAILIGFFGMILVFAAVSMLIQWLYHAYLESGETQATWGKQALGLYVTDLMGNPVTFGRASGRFFAKIVTGMIPLGIGYIMAGFTERKQALHDMIASCLVVRR
ncbi:MAG TPA: RDD family protein [Candidatus Acidoferrum sp.]|nr:RDD family protein [Candidatus Acidoferrum sp.]